MFMVINHVVKKSYLSNWVFTAMQSAHIRINSSLSPPRKNPGSACERVDMQRENENVCPIVIINSGIRKRSQFFPPR